MKMASYSRVSYTVPDITPLYTYIGIAIAPSDATTNPSPAGPSEFEHISFEEYLND